MIAAWDPALIASSGTQDAAKQQPAPDEAEARPLEDRLAGDAHRRRRSDLPVPLDTGALGAVTTFVQVDLIRAALFVGMVLSTNTSTSPAGIQAPNDLDSYVYGPFPSGVADTQSPAFAGMRWARYVHSRLLEMLDQSKAADRRSSYPVPGVINRAWGEALALFPPLTATPSVVPSDEGSVVFVWHKGGWDVEIEVDHQEAMVWARNRANPRLESLDGRVADQRDRVTALLKSLSIT